MGGRGDGCFLAGRKVGLKWLCRLRSETERHAISPFLRAPMPQLRPDGSPGDLWARRGLRAISRAGSIAYERHSADRAPGLQREGSSGARLDFCKPLDTHRLSEGRSGRRLRRLVRKHDDEGREVGYDPNRRDGLHQDRRVLAGRGGRLAYLSPSRRLRGSRRAFRRRQRVERASQSVAEPIDSAAATRADFGAFGH